MKCEDDAKIYEKLQGIVYQVEEVITGIDEDLNNLNNPNVHENMRNVTLYVENNEDTKMSSLINIKN